MRLIHTGTLQIENFLDNEVPEYAILSHTWDKEEVTYQDIQESKASAKQGFTKLQRCCERAWDDGFTYCWIDSCCIDKTSSAELSEAINSMYTWYKNSCICYVWLADYGANSVSSLGISMSFSHCRWFTRGWTLQELIAPKVVEFYDANWKRIGTKLSLQSQISDITGIDKEILRGSQLPSVRNIADRMSWAAKRETSRIEDQAYCLLGLFEVNMPLLYGEGRRAFSRLQEEIMRTREDYTLFIWFPRALWHPQESKSEVSSRILAESPADFTFTMGVWNFEAGTTNTLPLWTVGDLHRDCASLLDLPPDHEPPLLTSRGIRLTVPVFERKGELFAALSTLPVRRDGNFVVCVLLHRTSMPRHDVYMRIPGNDVTIFSRRTVKMARWKTIYILQPAPKASPPNHVRRHLFSSPAPSVVIVKMNDIAQLQCHSSTWLNMRSVLAARFPQLYKAPPASDEPSVKSTFAPGYYEPHDAHRLNKAVDSLIQLSHEDIRSLSHGSHHDLCWFSDADTKHNLYTRGARGVLSFLSDGLHPDTACIVRIDLYGDRPLCGVTLLDAREVRSNNMQDLVAALMESPKLEGDSDTARLAFIDGHALPYLEITVSIRRIASAFSKICRFVVSIHQRIVSEEEDVSLRYAEPGLQGKGAPAIP
jgi:hypothetical protein